MKTLIAIGLLFIPMLFIGQQKAVESLTKKLEEYKKDDSGKADLMLQLAASYYGTNTQKLSETAKDAYQLSSSINYKKGAAEALKLQGAAAISQGDFPGAESYFTQSLNGFQQINYLPGIAVCYSNLGSVKLYQNQYANALKLYQTSIRYAEKAGDYKTSAMAYGNMGIIYSEMKDYHKALLKFTSALQNHTQAKNENGMASSYSNIGTVYFNQDRNEEALQYYQLALSKNQEIGNQLGIARESGNLASLYMKINRYQDAFNNVKAALKINEELNNKKGVALNNQQLGEFYLHEKQYEKALDHFRKSVKKATEIGAKDIEKANFKSINELYDQRNMADSAYYFYKKFVGLKEDMDNETNRKQISRLEIQYEFDSKEEKYKTQQIIDQERLKQNQLLLSINNLRLSESNKERDLAQMGIQRTESELRNKKLESDARQKQLEISRKENQLKQNEIKVNKLRLNEKEKERWYLLSGVSVFALIGGLLFYQNQQRKKANRKLEVLNQQLDRANQNKIRFFGILNHDLRSPVAKLIHFLHLQKAAPDLIDPAHKIQLENQATASAEQLLAQMEDLLLWSKSQMENFQPQKRYFSAEAIFSELKMEWSGQNSTEFLYQYHPDLQMFTDKEFLKTILRNLVSNAQKVLQNRSDAKIWIGTAERSNEVVISVKDNGGGTSLEKFKALYEEDASLGIKHGLGLHVIRDFAKAIGSEVAVSTNTQTGETSIEVRLKK